MTFTLYKILTSTLTQIALLGLFACATVYWGFSGLDWIKQKSEPKSERTFRELTEKVISKDPALAAELEKLRQEHDIIAIAATLKTRDKIEGIDGLTRLANEAKEKRAIYELQLADYAIDYRLVNSNEREHFLTAHANHRQHLRYIRGQTTDINLRMHLDNKEAEYLRFLDEAKHDPNIWRKVKDNPMYVQLTMLGIEQPLLDFYDVEKDWLGDVLFALITAMAAESGDPAEDVCRMMKTIQMYHPIFRDAVKHSFADKESDVFATYTTIFMLFDICTVQVIFRNWSCLNSVFCSITRFSFSRKTYGKAI